MMNNFRDEIKGNHLKKKRNTKVNKYKYQNIQLMKAERGDGLEGRPVGWMVG